MQQNKYTSGEDATSILLELSDRLSEYVELAGDYFTPCRVYWLSKQCAALENLIYGGAMTSLRQTCLNHKGGEISEQEYSELQPMLDRWADITGDDANIDADDFSAFCDDLAGYSGKVRIITEGFTMLDLLNNSVWNPFFKDFEDQLLALKEKARGQIQRSTHKFELLAATNYSGFDPYEFEELVEDLFKGLGYEAEVTAKSGDYGVDVLAEKDRDRVAIQVKNYSPGNNVGAQAVQQLIGAMAYEGYQANKGIIVTTSDYTVRALEQAKGSPVEL